VTQHLKLTQFFFENAKEPLCVTRTGAFYLCLNEQWRMGPKQVTRVNGEGVVEQLDRVEILTAHLHAAVIVNYSVDELEGLVDDLMINQMSFKDATKE